MPTAGHFAIGPQREALPLCQRYVDGTMTVETRWASLLGHRLPVARRRRGPHRPDPGDQRAGQGRRRRSRRGPSSGRRLFICASTRAVCGCSAPTSRWCCAPRRGVGDHARRHPPDRAGRRRPVRRAESSWNCGAAPKIWRRARSTTSSRRERAESYWSDWVPRSTLPSLKPELMKRSALTLRGLVHADTGAIMAAATTSLPEEIGGVRNWDYRYCWLRDAALTASALVSLGSLGEAEGYLDWVHGVIETLPGPERLHPLYTLSGAILAPRPSSTRCPATRARGRCASATPPMSKCNSTCSAPSSQLISDLCHARERPTVCADALDGSRTGNWSAPWCPPSSAAGSNPTTASGRSAAIRATTCTRR